MSEDGHRDGGGRATVLDRESQKVEPPKMHHVIVLNDDFTPFDFVERTLCDVFRMSVAQAQQKAQEIHQTGKTICGRFSREIAESKARQVIDRARAEDHPLIAISEPAP